VTTINLQSLENLARERGGGNRGALLRAVTECFFLGEGRHAAVELALFDDVIRLVLAEVEPQARAELATRLAPVRRPPPVVLLRLAHDEILVAEPILKGSPALDDAALTRLAGELSQDHLAAIAGRTRLGEGVTDVLVVRGDDRVVVRVAANDGARFSAAGFTTLADRAQVNVALRERLGDRADLPDAVIARVAPVIGGILIARIAGELDAASDELLAPPPRYGAGANRALDELLDLVARGLISLDEAATELADADAAAAVAQLVSRRTGLAADATLRALFAPTEELVTVLCRAASLHLDGFSAVLRMRRRRRRGAGAQPAEALAAFLRLPVETAQRVVRFLKDREGRS
jgi:hypothetical protein